MTQNRQVGLKNLHIIDALPSRSWNAIRFYPRATTDIFRFGALPKGWSLSLVLPKQVPLSKITYTGYKAKLVSRAEHTRISKQLGKQAELYDLKATLVAAASREGCTITGVPAREQGIPILVAFTADARSGTGTVQLIQESRRSARAGRKHVLAPWRQRQCPAARGREKALIPKRVGTGRQQTRSPETELKFAEPRRADLKDASD